MPDWMEALANAWFDPNGAISTEGVRSIAWLVVGAVLLACILHDILRPKRK